MSSVGFKSNGEYRAEARYQLSGKWIMAVLVIFISWIFTQAFASRGVDYSWVNGEMVRQRASGVNIFASLLSLILAGPLNLGVASYFLKLMRGKNPQLEDIFSGFKRFANAFLVNLLILIFTVLWAAIAVVPGVIIGIFSREPLVILLLIIIVSIAATVLVIIAYLRYSMSYYILNDNPEMSALEAIRASKEMMRGSKGKLFMLILSFIGWFIVGLIALVIGLLWVGAYFNTAKVNFYEDLKKNAISDRILNDY
jgi:uncharacterized membrane protein